MFFLFQRYRDIFASNIHIHLDNTFNFFFIYRCVVFEKQFWKFILKKKQQQNKQTSKTKKKTYSFSDIRYSNYWYKKIIFCYQKIPQKYQNGAPLSQRDTLGRCWMLLKSGKSDHFCFLVLPPATGVSQTT